MYMYLKGINDLINVKQYPMTK